MPRGRKPLPDAVKALRGNPGKRKRRIDPTPPLPGVAAEPAANQVAALPVPPAPDYLPEVARAEWERLAGELVNQGLLRVCDSKAFELRCVLYDRWRQAVAKIAEVGTSYEHNGVWRMRPEVKIAEKAEAQMRAFDGEFGLTPAARARVTHVTGSGGRGAQQSELPLPASQAASKQEPAPKKPPAPGAVPDWTDEEFFRGAPPN